MIIVTVLTEQSSYQHRHHKQTPFTDMMPNLSKSKNHIDHTNKNSSRARTNGICEKLILEKLIWGLRPLRPLGRGLLAPLPSPQRPDIIGQPANYSVSRSWLRGEQRQRWRKVKEKIKIYNEVVVGRNQFMLTLMTL